MKEEYMKLKEDARQIFTAAIDAVKPNRLMANQVKIEGEQMRIRDFSLHLSEFRNIYVVGAGKASALMAQELEKLLGERITAGAVVVKYGYSVPCRKIRIYEGGHPIIDENGLKGSEAVLEIVRQAGEKDLVLGLISGGGSALLEKLPDGIALADLQRTFQLLLESGATIEEINAVRKHLSLTKGGQLARAIYPATGVSLILSDVIGDPLEAIASGPMAPDTTTFADAWQVISKYSLTDKLPAPVAQYLRKGLCGEAPETLKPGDPIFEKMTNIILGNNLLALRAAEDTAKKLGYHTLILSSRMEGEAREVGKVLAAIAKEELATQQPLPRPACLLMGGETTVTIRGKGKGGRNQELVLAALISMKAVTGSYLIASVGTDGTDGPTDAAGGWCYPEIWKKALDQELKPEQFLLNNDSYHFLQEVDGLIRTGPTGTNVMDIMFLLVP